MLINESHLKQHLLNLSQIWRKGKFTRVSKSVMIEADRKLQEWAENFVRTHPTMGTTLIAPEYKVKKIKLDGTCTVRCEEEE